MMCLLFGRPDEEAMAKLHRRSPQWLLRESLPMVMVQVPGNVSTDEGWAEPLPLRKGQVET